MGSWQGKVLILCALGFSVFIVLAMEGPVSPAANLPGKSEGFDALLADANSKWSFVFVNDTQVKLADIYGNEEKVLLDLKEATAGQGTGFLDSFSISPDGRFLLAAYYHTYSKEGKLNERLLLLDLSDLSTQDVPVEHGDFKMHWPKNTLWLNENTFLIPYLRYETDQLLGKVTLYSYVLKKLEDLQSSEFFTLPTKHETDVWYPESSSLLYFHPYDPVSVWAIDIDGQRPATQLEQRYYNNKRQDELYDPASPVSVEVERVTDSVASWAKKYRQEHSDRYWIRLDGKIARCADGGDLTWWRKPAWDKDMRLLTWHEVTRSCQIFYMDSKGHYRKWRTGRYCGKIPKK